MLPRRSADFLLQIGRQKTVGLELAQDGIDRAVGNVDALLQPVGYLVVVAVTLVQQCQHAQLEHALCQ